ncbi:MAG: hypothetical protein WDK96_00230 [Candidatus Paceibacterota bacterium]|jgi:hypothetical protein
MKKRVYFIAFDNPLVKVCTSGVFPLEIVVDLTRLYDNGDLKREMRWQFFGELEDGSFDLIIIKEDIFQAIEEFFASEFKTLILFFNNKYLSYFKEVTKEQEEYILQTTEIIFCDDVLNLNLGEYLKKKKILCTLNFEGERLSINRISTEDIPNSFSKKFIPLN